MKSLILSLVVATAILAVGGSAFAHSGRTTTNNDCGIPGHVDHVTGMWHSHI